MRLYYIRFFYATCLQLNCFGFAVVEKKYNFLSFK